MRGIQKSHRESNQLRLSLCLWPLVALPFAVWCCTLQWTPTLTTYSLTHTHIPPLLTVTSASLCCSRRSLFTLQTSNLLLDWLCSLGPSVPPHSHTHAQSHKHKYYTHTCRQTHRPAACYMVPARGRLLHLSLSNLNPLAQQQLAPISSPLGLGFIKDTVMYTAACSGLSSSSHRSQVTVRTNGMWLTGQRNVLECGAQKLLTVFPQTYHGL